MFGKSWVNKQVAAQKEDLNAMDVKFMCVCVPVLGRRGKGVGTESSGTVGANGDASLGKCPVTSLCFTLGLLMWDEGLRGKRLGRTSYHSDIY